MTKNRLADTADDPPRQPATGMRPHYHKLALEPGGKIDNVFAWLAAGDVISHSFGG